MRVTRRRGLALELEAYEAGVLDDLFREAERMLDDPDDAVATRLFPDAYPDDAAASAQFRELTTGSERRDRVATCRAQLGPDAADADRRVDLADPDVAQAWIRALNEVRLVLGTRLGVTADDDHHERALDPTDPLDQAWQVYRWLTAMQDTIVVALMR